MLVKSARFITSSADASGLPKNKLPEFAFIGRSNVGKSSLINMLCRMKGLAKTSGQPGKTKLINHFLINDSFFFVDLPGYGFAKTGKAFREQFESLITTYITGRANLRCLFVLIDIRLPLQQIDLEFMNWLGEKEIPFAIVFTKCDKLSKSELGKSFERFRSQLLRWWEELPGYFFTSSLKNAGREELLGYLGELLSEKQKP